jgi:hypothetical protein
MDVRTAASNPPNEYIGGQVIAAIAAIFPIVLITLAFRLYSRFWIVKSPGWDDWTIILATASEIRLLKGASQTESYKRLTRHSAAH